MKVFVIAVVVFLLVLTIINKISIRLGFKKANPSQKPILVFGIVFSCLATILIVFYNYYYNLPLFSTKLLVPLVLLLMFADQYRRSIEN